MSADWNGDFGTLNVGSAEVRIRRIYLSNYNGLSNLDVKTVRLSNKTDFSIVQGTDTCSGKTLYPANVGTPTSCEVTVRFSPASYGTKEGTTIFVSNSDTPLKQALKGTGEGGAVKVTITPTAARTAGAKWRADGNKW